MKLGDVNRKTNERSLPRNKVRQPIRSFVRNRVQTVLEVIFPNRFKASGPGPQRSTVYEPPRMVRLTPEQAKLKLLGHLSMGDEGAKDLLDLVFPEPVVESTSPEQGESQRRG